MVVCLATVFEPVVSAPACFKVVPIDSPRSGDSNGATFVKIGQSAPRALRALLCGNRSDLELLRATECFCNSSRGSLGHIGALLAAPGDVPGCLISD